MNFKVINVDELEASLFTRFKNELQDFLLTSKEQDVLFTRKQAAEFLNVTLVTLHEWTKLGLVKSGRIGRRVYYKKSDLLAATSIEKP